MYKKSKNKKTLKVNFYVLFLILVLQNCLCSSVRQLDSSQNPPQNDPEEPKKQQNNTMLSLDKNTFLLVLIIGSIVFVVIALVCCVVCIVRCILKIQRRSGFGSSKITNIGVDVGNIWGGVTYKMFQMYVGQPFQPHCVICLEQFKSNTQEAIKSCKKNQQSDFEISLHEAHPNIFYHSQPSPQLEPKPLCQATQTRMQSRQTQYNEQQNVQVPVAITSSDRVKLTVCGHLLHEKCLNEWFEKEQNCPLCRQSFTYQSFKIWGLRLGIDLIQFAGDLQLLEQGLHSKCKNLLQNNPIKHKFPQQHRPDYPRSSITQNQTLNSIAKSRQSNRVQQQYQNQYQIICQSQLPALDKQILLLYFIIMVYHRRIPQHNQNKNVKRIQEIIQQNYVAQGDQNQLYFQEREDREKLKKVQSSGEDNLEFGTTLAISVCQRSQLKKKRATSRVSSKFRPEKHQEISFYNQNMHSSNQ